MAVEITVQRESNGNGVTYSETVKINLLAGLDGLQPGPDP